MRDPGGVIVQSLEGYLTFLAQNPSKTASRLTPQTAMKVCFAEKPICFTD